MGAGTHRLLEAQGKREETEGKEARELIHVVKVIVQSPAHLYIIIVGSRIPWSQG